MARVVHHERDRGEMRIEPAHGGIVWPLLLAELPGGEILFVSGAARPDHMLRRWDLTTGAILWETAEGDLADGCFGLALSLARGQQILAAATEAGVRRWEAGTGRPLPGTANPPPRSIWDVATCDAGDGRVLLLGAGNDHLIHRWDAVTARSAGAPLRGHDCSVKCVTTARVPGLGPLIASGGDDGTVRLWRGADGEIVRTFTVDADVLDVDLFVPAAGAPVLTCADSEGMLHRSHPESGEPLGPPIATGGMVGSLVSAEVAGEPRLLVSSEHGFRQWHVATGRLLEATEPGISVAALRRADGSVILATGRDNGDIHVRTLV